MKVLLASSTLIPTLEAIFAGFSKSTRYEINRARERDGIETSLSCAPPDGQLDEFMNYFDEFAATKGVPRIHRAQLQALASAKKLALSVAGATRPIAEG